MQVPERLRPLVSALEADDVRYVASRLPKAASASAVLIAFHKARYELVLVSDKKRIESRDWLLSHGLSAYGGRRIVPGEPLPR